MALLCQSEIRPGRRRRIKRGDSLRSRLNELPVPAELNWHGLAGYPASLFSRAPVWRQGMCRFFQIPFQQAALSFAISPSGDGSGAHLAALALTCRKPRPSRWIATKVFLIEDWRLRPDGTAMAPGTDPKGRDAALHDQPQKFAGCHQRTHDVAMRFINACQRSVTAIKIPREITTFASWRWTASLRNRSSAQRRRGAGAGAAGRCFSSMQPRRPHTSSILLHDASGSADRQACHLQRPPVRSARCAALRCPPTACRRSRSEERMRVDLASARRNPNGWRRRISSRQAAPAFPRQNRTCRGAWR